MSLPTVRALGDLAREGAAYLEERKVPSARFDAEVLLARALGLDRSGLHSRLREAVPPEVEAAFRCSLERRGRRIPLQHVTGRQEFWSLELAVDHRVLIPRPETEIVVEAALACALSPSPASSSPAPPCLIADIGTGSGNIAIALARELPEARIWATDISSQALEVALSNAVRYGVEERIRFLQGDLADPLEGRLAPGSLDLLVSNPPYVAAAELAVLEPEVRDHEPRQALTPPGGEALELYPGLLQAGRRFLRSGGHLILELPAGGAERMPSLLRDACDLELVEIRSDYSGIPRVLVVQRA
jgi:release factor glutamine methyltransferase